MTRRGRLDMLDDAGEHDIVKQVQDKRMRCRGSPCNGVFGVNRWIRDLSDLSEVDPHQAAGENLNVGAERRVALDLGEQAADLGFVVCIWWF